MARRTVRNWTIGIIIKIGEMFVKGIKFVFKWAFDIIKFIYDLMFGSFKGIFAGKNKYGPRYTYKYLRYFITLIVPPIGIFFTKGFSGWFSMILCTVLCMMNYFIGIIYAFVVMHSKGYAGRYEKVQMKKAKKIADESDIKHQNTFPILFISMLIMFGIIAFIFGSAKLITD